MAANSTVNIASRVCSSQSTEVSTAVFDRQATGTAGPQRTCQGPLAARSYSPPTISPVWLCVNPPLQEEEARCDQTDTQQDSRQGRVQDRQQDDQQYDWHDDQSFDQQDDQQHGEQDEQQGVQQDDQQGRQQHDWQDIQQNGEQDVLRLQEGCQPAAKRHKQTDQDGFRSAVTHQQQLLVPLPPLRFFLRSADEIASVYQPSRPPLVPAKQ